MVEVELVWGKVPSVGSEGIFWMGAVGEEGEFPRGAVGHKIIAETAPLQGCGDFREEHPGG